MSQPSKFDQRREQLIELQRMFSTGERNALDVACAILRDETASVLHAAVVALLPAGPEVEDLALDVAARAPAEVGSSACRLLARIGRPDTLEKLTSLATVPALREAATFAHVIVSHRAGRPSCLLEPPESLTKVGLPAMPVSSSPMSERDLSVLLRDLSRYARLASTARTAIEITCQKTRWAFSPSEAIATEGTLPLGAAPAVVGAVAYWNEAASAWMATNIVVGGPMSSNDARYLAVFRNDGPLVMWGTAAPSEELFVVRSVRRRGADSFLLNAVIGRNTVVSGIVARSEPGLPLATLASPPGS